MIVLIFTQSFEFLETDDRDFLHANLQIKCIGEISYSSSTSFIF